MDIEEFAWVKASEYRQNILLTLLGTPSTPKDIAEETGYYLSHVSNTLSELQDHGLAECITPDRKKGRLYTATDEGEELAESLLE
ncbi:MAG: transcriptional regulator [Halobacteriaceae archaeon]